MTKTLTTRIFLTGPQVDNEGNALLALCHTEAQLGEPQKRQHTTAWSRRPRTTANTMLVHLPFHEGVNSRRTQLQQVLDVFDPNVNFARGRILGTCHLGEEEHCRASLYDS